VIIGHSSQLKTMQKFCRSPKKSRRQSQLSDSRTTEENIEKFKDIMRKRRRIHVQHKLNLRKRHPLPPQESKRKTKIEYFFLSLTKEHLGQDHV
jgi:hypothetical protein